jgi:hypothetical protein
MRDAATSGCGIDAGMRISNSNVGGSESVYVSPICSAIQIPRDHGRDSGQHRQRAQRAGLERRRAAAGANHQPDRDRHADQAADRADGEEGEHAAPALEVADAAHAATHTVTTPTTSQPTTAATIPASAASR